MAILEVKDLAVYFGESPKLVKAIDHSSFSLDTGGILGIVGESGSGKTMTALAIMRLLPPTARLVSGSIQFEGENLLSISENKMCQIRGRKIAMIFQDPTSALNPVVCIGEQIKEMVRYHRADIAKKNHKNFVIDLLQQVGIPDPQLRYCSFPHELSGGMNQRAVIAMALAVKPTIILADEPTTALDATIQAKILDELTSMVSQLGISLILITHNLGLIAEYVDRVLVMKEGRIVEQGSVFQLFSHPLDPYTKHLLEVVPKLPDSAILRKETKNDPRN